MSISAGAKARLLSKPHVVAVWTDRKTGKVVCGVDRKVPRHSLSAEQVVPKEIEGRSTDIVAFAKLPTVRPLPATDSEIGALAAPQSLTSRQRPCPGGFSVGHNKITAGTNGCWVKDKEGAWVMLSNNHVLANSNEGVQGDVITQPGPYDLEDVTTNPTTWIGRLRDFAKINTESGGGLPGGCSIPGADRIFGGAKPRGVIEQPMPNLVDAAIAEPFGGEGNAVDPAIYKIGVPSGMRPPQVGEAVKKSGRTTEYTTDDQIEAIDLAVTVGYESFQALFAEQILIISDDEPFSQPGDSGSAIIAQADNAMVGLLFAGGTLEDGRDATIACQIQHVQEILGVGL